MMFSGGHYGIVDTSAIQNSLDFGIGGSPDRTYIVASSNVERTQATVDAMRPPRRVPKPQWWLVAVAAVIGVIAAGGAEWSIWAAIIVTILAIWRQIRASRRWIRWSRQVWLHIGSEAKKAIYSDLQERLEGISLTNALREGDPELAARFVCRYAEFEPHAAGDVDDPVYRERYAAMREAADAFAASTYQRR